MIPRGYWVATHQVPWEKGEQQRQAFKKTTLKKTSTGFYVFIRGLRFGRSLSCVIVNCKLHEAFPILTVAGLIFTLSTKEESQYVTIGLFFLFFII
jgi:hypothetical protein